MKINIKRFNMENLLLILCLFCVSWLNHGFAGQFGIVNFKIFILQFGLWFIFALHRNNWHLKISNIWFGIYTALLWIYSLTHTEVFNIITYASVYILILSVFYDYYSAPKLHQERKIILSFYLFENLLVALRTAYVCFRDPMFSRNITGSVENVSGYLDLFIARFEHIYTFSMIAVLLLVIAPKMRHKVFFYICAAVFMVCIYYANYSTALFITILFIASIIVFRRPKRILMAMVIAMLLVSVLTPFLADIVLQIANQNGISYFIKRKLYDVYDFMLGTGRYNPNNTLYARTKFSMDAVQVFKEHFLIGIYGRPSCADLVPRIHDHNVWFDMLAYFGVVRIIPYLMIFYRYYQNIKKYFAQWNISPLSLMLLLWVIYGFVNPVGRTANHIFLFFILPLFGQYYMDEHSGLLKTKAK